MTSQYRPTLADPVMLSLYTSDMGRPVIPDDSATAFLVCHGMGQQVPFETLDCVAKAICATHIAQGGKADIVLRMVKAGNDDKLMPRVELTLKTDDGSSDGHVHLYEAYWAPVTEGVITYAQTAAFMVRAGIDGIIASVKGRFDRWIFGELRWLPVDGNTLRMLVALVLLLAPLLFLAGSAALGALLAQLVFGDGGGRQWVQSKNFSLSGVRFGSVVLALALWFLFRKLRQFVLQYMGDVAIYVSSNEVNGFWRAREEIKSIGLRVASTIYSSIRDRSAESEEHALPPQTQDGEVELAYGKVVVIGHSLGSVVAYDVINAIINRDQVTGRQLQVSKRTGAMITLGSPLDKTAFLFRQDVKSGVVREALAAGVQPLIQSYDFRPQWWLNVFCRRDIVSGPLEYYDHPIAIAEARRVRNYEDAAKTWNPIAAHTKYWERQPTQDFIYLAAIGMLGKLSSPQCKYMEQVKRVVDQQPSHRK